MPSYSQSFEAQLAACKPLELPQLIVPLLPPGIPSDLPLPEVTGQFPVSANRRPAMPSANSRSFAKCHCKPDSQFDVDESYMTGQSHPGWMLSVVGPSLDTRLTSISSLQAAATVLQAYPPRGALNLQLSINKQPVISLLSGIDRIVAQEYVIDTIHYFDGDNNELARRLGIGVQPPQWSAQGYCTNHVLHQNVYERIGLCWKMRRSLRLILRSCCLPGFFASAAPVVGVRASLLVPCTLGVLCCIGSCTKQGAACLSCLLTAMLL